MITEALVTMGFLAMIVWKIGNKILQDTCLYFDWVMSQKNSTITKLQYFMPKMCLTCFGHGLLNFVLYNLVVEKNECCIRVIEKNYPAIKL